MRRIKVDANTLQSGEMAEIIKAVKAGLVIAYPTDTVYGLGGDATSREVIKKIFKIKERDGKKPLIILVGSFSFLKKFCYVNKKQDEYLRKVWEISKSPCPLYQGSCNENRPTTVLLKSRGLLPAELSGGGDSLAVRMPQSEWLKKLIKKLKAPLISTSLNLSGQAPLNDLNLIDEYFKAAKPDLVIDGGKLDGRPSRLVDLLDIDDIKVVRE